MKISFTNRTFAKLLKTLIVVSLIFAAYVLGKNEDNKDNKEKTKKINSTSESSGYDDIYGPDYNWDDIYNYE